MATVKHGDKVFDGSDPDQPYGILVNERWSWSKTPGGPEILTCCHYPVSELPASWKLGWPGDSAPVKPGDVYLDNEDENGVPFAKVTKVNGDYIHVDYYATSDCSGEAEWDNIFDSLPDDRFTKLTVPAELYMLRHGDSDDWVVAHSSDSPEGYSVFLSLSDANDGADWCVDKYGFEIKPIVVRVK